MEEENEIALARALLSLTARKIWPAQPSGELKRVELYDLVFRMPPSNLHHHRCG